LNNGKPSHPAISVVDGPSINYRELCRQVDDLAATLGKLGLGNGDRIAMALPNGVEVIALFLAASTVGTAAPLNPAYTRDEFKFYLEDTSARALILPKDGSEEARAAAIDLKVPIIDSSIDDNDRVRFSSSGQLNDPTAG